MAAVFLLVVLFLFLGRNSQCLDNGLALTPPSKDCVADCVADIYLTEMLPQWVGCSGKGLPAMWIATKIPATALGINDKT